MATKVLMANAILTWNNFSLNLTDELEGQLQKVNDLITKSKQKWAILLHHDGITGTQQHATEEDYYVILQAAQDYLKEARDLLNSEILSSLQTTNVHFKTNLASKLSK